MLLVEMNSIFWYALSFRFRQLPQYKLKSSSQVIDSSVLAQPSLSNLLLGLLFLVHFWFCFSRRFHRFWDQIDAQWNHIGSETIMVVSNKNKSGLLVLTVVRKSMLPWTLKMLHVCAMKLYVVQKRSTERPGIIWKNPVFVETCHRFYVVHCCMFVCCQRFEAEKTQQQLQGILEAVFLSGGCL